MPMKGSFYGVCALTQQNCNDMPRSGAGSGSAMMVPKPVAKLIFYTGFSSFQGEASLTSLQSFEHVFFEKPVKHDF